MKPKPYSLTATLLLVTLSAWPQLLNAQDSNQGKWTATGDLLTARICHTATLLSNGQVLIVGGHGYSDDLASVELYKPDQGIFVAASDLSPGRTNHTATLLTNGQVLVVGGQSNGRTLDSADLYNPATGAWTHTGSLHIARSYHTATLLQNGQVLISGGIRVASPPVFSQGAPPGSALDSAELYDPISGKWTVTGSLHEARYTHTSTLLPSGQVLVSGGLSSQGFGDALTSSELYNPVTKTWTETGKLSNPRFYPAAVLLTNGKVLIAGGQAHETRYTSTELYNTSTGTWSPTGDLRISVSVSNATLLPNGHVLISGGTLDSGVTTSAESYDPTLGTWEKLADMNTARSLHTATLLPNGKVLVTGGGNGNGSPSGVLASAELFDPKGGIIQQPVPNEVVPPIAAQPSAPASSLINLAASMVVITTCVVILTACVVILLVAWLVFVLVRRWRK